MCAGIGEAIRKGRFWPIVLKKSLRSNCPEIDRGKRHFCSLQGDRPRTSVSDEYFSAAETKTDFFNRIGRLLPVAK